MAELTSHDIALEFARFLELLRGSYAEKYRSFYNKSTNCKYTKKALILFERKDQERFLKALDLLHKRLIKDTQTHRPI